MSQHMHQLRWVLSAVVLSVSAPGWYGSPAPVLGADPDAAEILPRWRHHAESIETLRVKWKQQITYAPGSYHGKDLRTHDENGREFPGKSAEVTSDCRVVLKGQKWRYETIGVKWQPEVEQFAASEDITASDGTTVTSFQGIDASIDKAHPLAFLYRSETTISKARMPVAAPVFLFARPFQKPIGHLLRWEGTAPSVRQSADNPNLVDLAYQVAGQPAGTEVTYRVFLDRPWLLRRMSVADRQVTEIRFATADAAAPSGWIYTLRNPDGTVRLVFEAEVTSWEVNVPIDDEEFEVKLPPGTQVWDHTGRNVESGIPPSWIVRDEGEERPVTTREIKANVAYPDLLVTEPDEAIPTSTESRGWLVKLIAAAIVFAALAAAFAAWRRRHSA